MQRNDSFMHYPRVSGCPVSACQCRRCSSHQPASMHAPPMSASKHRLPAGLTGMRHHALHVHLDPVDATVCMAAGPLPSHQQLQGSGCRQLQTLQGSSLGW